MVLNLQPLNWGLNNYIMAHNKVKIFEKAKEQIVKNNLFFIEDIAAFVGCSKTYFYEAFPIDSDEMNELKEMLNVNRVKTKSSIRAKLYKGEKAAELLSLYRLICTPEERQNLNQSYIDHTTKGEQLTTSSDTIELLNKLNEKLST